MPAGLLVTVPLPVPDLVTVRVYCGCAVNVAVTLVAAVMVTVHVPVPEHPPPDHPVNVEPEAAVAVNMTLVPEVYDSLQSEPQSMPDGLLVTVPLPVPDLVTVRVYLGVSVTTR